MTSAHIVYAARVDDLPRAELLVPSYRTRCDYCAAEVWVAVANWVAREAPAICSPCLLALNDQLRKSRQLNAGGSMERAGESPAPPPVNTIRAELDVDWMRGPLRGLLDSDATGEK